MMGRVSFRAIACQAALALAMISALAAQPAAAIDPTAINLMQAYLLAIGSEPNYLAAHAVATGAREALPQARAQFLPNIQLSGTVGKADTDITTVSTGASVQRNYRTHNYAFTISQPLLHYESVANYAQAKARVKSTDADLDQALIDLSQQLVEAYLNVLLAGDRNDSFEVQKTSALSTLDATKRSLALGHGTRTDIDDAQARYDSVAAQKLDAEQNVEYSKRQLSVLIDQPVTGIAKLDPGHLDLSPPVPATLDYWLARAEAMNPSIKSLVAAKEAARQAIKKASAGHLPTLDAVYQDSDSESDSELSINQRYQTSRYSLQLKIPLYSGGYTSSVKRQAIAAEDQANLKLEAARRSLQLKVQKQLNEVIHGVENIQALQVAKSSADQLVFSTRKGVLAGTRSRLDVFDAQQKAAIADLNLAEARYRLVLARMLLEALSGEGNMAAIERINRSLVSGTQVDRR